jgi:pyruvate dehydrogenase kinase 2/3/4
MIVSSSSTMASDDTTARAFFVKKEELENTTEEDLKLDVNMQELQQLASMRCTPLSLKDMYKYAVDFNDQEQRLRNAQFLHKELPVRIAQRAIDLLTLPHGLSEALPIKQIAHMYLLHLEKFQELPVPTTPEEEDEFTELLQSIVLNRTSIPMAIARGLNTWSKSHCAEELEMDRFQQMEEALYRFFTARVGLRFLTEHHILTSPRHASRSLLRKSQSSFAQDSEFLGCIQTDCDPIREIEKIVETVTLQTQDHFGVCPEIQIVDSSINEDSKFTYVPHHLHYMVGELLKNSCRATVKR